MTTRRSFIALSAASLGTLALTPRAHSQAAAPLEAAGEQFDQLHSLQVMRGDDVVFARAFRGPGLDRSANIKSCSKSLVALLLGCAIEVGHVPAVTATLQQTAPRLIPDGADPDVAGITLEDLVTLRAGLERTSGANYGSWVSSRNWVSNALSRPMVARPGTRMLYSTGSTHILGAALAEATGDSLLAQARRHIGRPLGIEIPAWSRDPQGYYLGGNEMALTPRAMLRIARMLRDKGRFEEQQVIPRDWIEASLTPRTRSPFSGMDYGYGWFLTRTGFALARGYGGQIIAAHPERGLAVAITSDPTRPARSHGYFGDLESLLNGPVLALA